MVEEIVEAMGEEEEEEGGEDVGCGGEREGFGAAGVEVLERSAWISARNLVSSESASDSVGLGGGGGGGDCSGAGRVGGVAGGEEDAQSQPMVTCSSRFKNLVMEMNT